jgi:CRP-like cAMP-binding protein
MSAAVFRKIVHRHSDLCDQLLALLASQIRMLANRVNEHSTLNVRHRIYAELLRLARPPQPGQTDAVISPPPTHAELASRVGARREAVTRELKVLERGRLLDRRRGALVLLDPVRLQRMIEEAA